MESRSYIHKMKGWRGIPLPVLRLTVTAVLFPLLTIYPAISSAAACKPLKGIGSKCSSDTNSARKKGHGSTTYTKVSHRHSPGTLSKSTQREHINLVNTAISFLGIPYRFGGEDLSGVDCSGLVRKVFAVHQVQLPRSAREQYGAGKQVAREYLDAGDLVFFRMSTRASHPDHVGIFIGDGRFIHASSREPRCVRVGDLSSDFYARAFVGAIRVDEGRQR